MREVDVGILRKSRINTIYPHADKTTPMGLFVSNQTDNKILSAILLLNLLQNEEDRPDFLLLALLVIVKQSL